MEPTDQALPESAVADAGEPERRRSRWPLGSLTIIVAVVIGAGVLLLGGDDSDTTATTAELPGARGLPTPNGSVAPDFSLVLLDGTEFQLAEHFVADGRPVLLNLWASWCPPCRAEMPALDAASQSHPGVLFLGVAVEDDPVAARQFAEQIDVSYPLAIDEADRVAQRYASPGLPATYFIDSDGIIVRTVFGQMNETEIDQLIAESFGL